MGYVPADLQVVSLAKSAPSGMEVFNGTNRPEFQKAQLDRIALIVVNPLQAVADVNVSLPISSGCHDSRWNVWRCTLTSAVLPFNWHKCFHWQLDRCDFN